MIAEGLHVSCLVSALKFTESSRKQEEGECKVTLPEGCMDTVVSTIMAPKTSVYVLISGTWD